MASDQAVDQCVQAFISRDYAACARQAQALLTAPASHKLMQLLLISLQRLGQSHQVQQWGSWALETSVGHPWFHSLLRLTLGSADPAQVLNQGSSGGSARGA